MVKMNLKSYYINCFFLLLLAIGFLDKSSYLLLILFASTIVLSPNKKIRLTTELAVLFICFLIFYFLYTMYYENTFMLFSFSNFFIGPIIGYLIGQLLVNGNEKHMKFVVLAICTMLLLHGAANLSRAADVKIWYDQFIPDIWTGEKVSGTLNGAYFTGGIVLAGYGLTKKGGFGKVVLLISVFLIVWSSISTAERTIALNLALSIIVLLYAKAYFANEGRERFAELTKNTLIIIGIFAIAAVAFINNLFGVQTAFMKTTLGERLMMLDSFTQDGRSVARQAVLRELWNHPMGNLGNMFYAHNLFVDTGRLCGIIPMLLLILYMVLCMTRMLKFCNNNEYVLEVRLIVFIYYFSFFVNFMLEPILEGMPMIFIMFCIVNGAISSFVRDNMQSTRGNADEYC